MGGVCLLSIIDGNTVVKVFCALCQEYYGTRQTGGPYVVGHKGAISSLADKWVSGTTVIKKKDAADHVAKSKLHRQATLALQSQSKASASGKDDASQVFQKENRMFQDRQHYLSILEKSMLHRGLNLRKSFS